MPHVTSQDLAMLPTTDSAQARLDLVVKPMSRAISRELAMSSHIRNSKAPNVHKVRWPVPSGLNVEKFRNCAQGFADAVVFDWLEFGFPINHDPSVDFNTKIVKNHTGALEYPEAVDAYIARELQYGALLGPFAVNPLDVPLAISPLNTVPKSDGVSRRIIVDCKSSRVNLGIDKDTYLGEPFKLELPSVDRIVDCINVYGRGCLLFKRDLKRAYRQFPGYPADYNKLGFSWRGRIYIDKRLAMGLRSAAACCQRSTTAVGYVFSKERNRQVVVYLDDFNGVVPKGLDGAIADFEALGRLLSEFGFEESLDKACFPSTSCIMLGIQFDTLKMVMRVTSERLKEISLLTQVWLSKISCSLTELQQLLGKLQFVCRCVRPGRIFLARLLNFLRTFNASNALVLNIPDQALKDINWFHKFLPRFNGVHVVPASVWEDPDVTFATDACLVGCGGVSGSRYFHTQFPGFILDQSLHISELELLTVIIALKLWSHYFKGRRISVFCDNEPSVLAINSGRIKNDFMQSALRELAYITALAQFELRAVHIQGVSNRIPDFLSRWSLHSKFQRLFFEETKDCQMVECTVDDALL